MPGRVFLHTLLQRGRYPHSPLIGYGADLAHPEGLPCYKYSKVFFLFAQGKKNIPEASSGDLCSAGA